MDTHAYIALLEIALLAMGSLYVANSKARGKVHRVIRGVNLPRGKPRVACGWRITKSVSSIFNCRRLKWGDYCCRCFPQGAPSGAKNKDEVSEAIEDYADEKVCGEKAK